MTQSMVTAAVGATGSTTKREAPGKNIELVHSLQAAIYLVCYDSVDLHFLPYLVNYVKLLYVLISYLHIIYKSYLVFTLYLHIKI